MRGGAAPCSMLAVSIFRGGDGAASSPTRGWRRRGTNFHVGVVRNGAAMVGKPMSHHELAHKRSRARQRRCPCFAPARRPAGLLWVLRSSVRQVRGNAFPAFRPMSRYWYSSQRQRLFRAERKTVQTFPKLVRGGVRVSVRALQYVKNSPPPHRRAPAPKRANLPETRARRRACLGEAVAKCEKFHGSVLRGLSWRTVSALGADGAARSSALC
jgi:hypothetical protein